MVYGILKFINFAHSDIVVLGAWLSLTLATWAEKAFGWGHPPPWWGGALVLLGAMVLCGTVGFTIERLAYKPLRGAPRLNVLITAIGVSLFLQNVGQLKYVFGASQKLMPSLLPNWSMVLRIGVGSVRIELVDVIIFVTATVLMLMLEYLV